MKTLAVMREQSIIRDRKYENLLNIFTLFHKNPSIFAVSQWQTNKNEPNLKYVLYRLLVMLQFLTTLVTSIVSHIIKNTKWLVFVTNWGYVICTIQAVLAFVLVASTLKNCKLQRKIEKLYPLYWLTNTVASPLAFGITIIYWVDRDEKDFEIMDYMVHGHNSVMMLLDIFIAAHPVRILHFVYPMIFGVTYSVFTFIYSYAGRYGYLGMYKSIYKRLNWEKPFSTVLICLGVTTLLVILHLVVVLFVFIREKVAGKFFGGSRSSEGIQPEVVFNPKAFSRSEIPEISTA